MTLEHKLRDTLDRFKAEHIGVDPNWQPLERLLPPDWLGGWMFMQGGLGPNGDITCYKHGITRKSLHVDNKGQCWLWRYSEMQREGMYTPIGSIEAVLAVYRDIEAIGGASPSTIYDSDYIQRRNEALNAAGYTVVG